VTADHGVAFTKGSLIRGVAAENYPEVMWTPLIVKAPDQQRGAVDDRAALGIDVLPTVADHLGVDMPWKVDGHSLLGTPRTEPKRRVLQWRFNSLKPPPGREYVTVAGPQGFATTLRGTASSAGGDPDLRLFRVGPYGGLVGSDPSPYVDDEAERTTGRIVRRRERAGAGPDDAPWLFVSGKLSGPNAPVRNVAVAVDGRIAAVTMTTSNALVPGLSIFSTVLAPELVRSPDGRIEVYLVDGDVAAPRLVPVTLTAPR
jgi:hypothetical protein